MSIRVLMVLDGEYRYAVPPDPADFDGAQDFTFTTLVGALDTPEFIVTKAHRDTDPTAEQQDFVFTADVLADHDVLWLFGYHGRNAFNIPSNTSSGAHLLTSAELDAIEAFMDAGGGVFATGDHDSIGADTGGHIRRVRAMRTWFGTGDPQGDTMPPGFPRNHDVIGVQQADTTQRNPQGDYSGETQDFVFFENQSDSIPQPIVPTTTPAHQILRLDGADISVFPDHMHEGNTLGEAELEPFVSDGALTDFPALAGDPELPEVIAVGQSIEQLSKFADGSFGGDFISTTVPSAKSINTLSVYDGRREGVGRIVTGSTFHHYIDINLTGDSDIDSPALWTLTGPDAAKGQGFAYSGAESTFAQIKAVYANITRWLARPTPTLQLILERSTFSQDEALVNGTFEGAFLVSVDGLKPSQYPGGGVTTLSPDQAQLDAWAPTLTLENDTGITITPTAVSSDDPALLDRIQRITFTYRVVIDAAAAFETDDELRTLRVDASLTAGGVSPSLTDRAWFQLVTAPSPFMLDLAGSNTATWLSSDVRVFRVVAGADKLGQSLPANATPDQARSFLESVTNEMTSTQFDSLPSIAADSALSPLPTTTGTDPKNVYNFAVARVRLNAGEATDVRVFFRIFTTQTTAALTYRRSGAATPTDGAPIAGYRQTADANPIALPGWTLGDDGWLSLPVFAAERVTPPESQTDGANVQDLTGPSETFYGALVDNNLDTPYLPTVPGDGPPMGMSTLLADAHQCLVAQIEYAGTPIPTEARPSTSDKLAQRNIAMSPVANPGLDASRVALHTFEIEATPAPITDEVWPDELMVDWQRPVPEGTSAALFIPSWNAQDVVDLADRFYARHGLHVLDEHTVGIPGGGLRFVPLPRHVTRRNGVVTIQFPRGIRKGQRFDVSIRQLTNAERHGEPPPYKGRQISSEEAQALIDEYRPPRGHESHNRPPLPRGAFAIGERDVLVTNPTAFDMPHDGALVLTVPSKDELAAFRRDSGRWRQTLGAFQIGIPVSDKQTMGDELARLLALLRWRTDSLQPTNPWFATYRHYLELLADKVRALGLDPFAIEPSPNPLLPQADPEEDLHADDGEDDDVDEDPFLEPGDDVWLDPTRGLDSPESAGAITCTGKITGLIFDHFGDPEGFVLENYAGSRLRFASGERAVCDIADTAWRERRVVTVITVTENSRRVRRLLIRGYP